MTEPKKPNAAEPQHETEDGDKDEAESFANIEPDDGTSFANINPDSE
jgi:hypothetical protein